MNFGSRSTGGPEAGIRRSTAVDGTDERWHTVDGVTTLEELGASSYALVTTFRKDGRAVPTPVWIVGFEDGLAFWTVHTFGKVKRIRRSKKVTVSTCDVRGNNAGPAVPGTAEILDYPGTERVRAALRGKYGILGWITLMGSRIRRGKQGTVGIKIVLTTG